MPRVAIAAAGAAIIAVALENTLHLQLPDAAREQIQREGFTMTRTITPESGAHRVHVVMRDTATGATGSVSIPLQP